MVIDKTLLANTMLRIVSLDLVPSFGWDFIVGSYAVSRSIIVFLIIQFGCSKRHIRANVSTKLLHEFDICAGVRKECVLTSGLFCSVPQQWDSARMTLNTLGSISTMRCRICWPLGCCGSAQEVGIMFHASVISVAHVGMKLNASKTKVFTTQQPPST